MKLVSKAGLAVNRGEICEGQRPSAQTTVVFGFAWRDEGGDFAQVTLEVRAIENERRLDDIEERIAIVVPLLRRRCDHLEHDLLVGVGV